MENLSDKDWARFWSKVRFTPMCWEWTASTARGYGQITLRGKWASAHRLAWTILRGPIPDGLTLDHLCRNRACVNPSHLEPVTMKVNLLRGNGACARHARKTHCNRGHPLVPGNLRHSQANDRRCLECHRQWNREYQQRRRLREKNTRF